MMSLGLILGGPFAAEAQPLAPGTTAPAAPSVAQPGTGREGSARAGLLAASAASTPAPGGFDPPGQKPPRPDNALGPDLVAYVFAPVGRIVGPITEGLHAFDAALAPVNAVLLPLTGPRTVASEAPPTPPSVPPLAAAEPTGRLPRK